MFTPSDFFYIVLAFCVLWLTAGLFWLIYQIAVMLRNINEAMADARRKLALIEETMVAIKNGLVGASASSRFVFDGVKSLVEFATSKRKGKSSRSSRRSHSSQEDD